MKIQNSINNNYQPQKNSSFKGMPFAKTVLKCAQEGDKVLIYRLEQQDVPFLLKMLKKLKLDKLAPDVKDVDQLDEWKELIKSAIERVGLDDNVFLAVKDKRPCGILSQMIRREGKSYESNSYITFLATWPDKINHNVKCAGKSLMRNLLEIANERNQNVTLIPSKNAPKAKRSCEAFYEKLGFQDIPNSKSNKKVIYKDNVYKTIFEELDPLMEYERLNNSKSENLEKTLDINYVPGIFKRIFSKN